MQALNKFKEELKAVWTPVIAVLASQEADDVCRSACGFGLVQLLRQFGNIQKMNAGLGGGTRLLFWHAPCKEDVACILF